MNLHPRTSLGISLVLAGCHSGTIGDPAPVTSLEVRNASNQMVVVYPYGHQHPRVFFTLLPGATNNGYGFTTRIEADDTQGILIFCRELTRAQWGSEAQWSAATYDEPLRMDVQIVPGQLTCATPQPSAVLNVGLRIVSA